MDVEEILKNIISRVEKLENTIYDQKNIGPVKSSKTLTLAEMARNKALANGQQKIAAIVGYYEKVLNQEGVSRGAIKEGWKDGKFSGYFADMLIHRSIKDGLIRDLKSGRYDLSQTGEDFFKEILGNKDDSQR